MTFWKFILVEIILAETVQVEILQVKDSCMINFKTGCTHVHVHTNGIWQQI